MKKSEIHSVIKAIPILAMMTNVTSKRIKSKMITARNPIPGIVGIWKAAKTEVRITPPVIKRKTF